MTSYEPIVPAIPTSLKHRNRKIVLDCFRDYQEHTVADIVTRTGISKLTVMRAIQFFCAKNIIVSSGKGSSTEQGGKKPEFFRFGYKKNLLTIMMWPEMLELRLFDMQMQELRRYSFDWIIPSTPEKAFSFVREQALLLLEQADSEVRQQFADRYHHARKELKKHTAFILKCSWFGKKEKITNLLLNLGLYRMLRPIFHRE